MGENSIISSVMDVTANCGLKTRQVASPLKRSLAAARGIINRIPTIPTMPSLLFEKVQGYLF